MRTMLIVMTVVAVVAALSPYRGVFNAMVGLAVVILWSVIPVTLGTLALYCRGHHQTFFLGAFAGSLAVLYLYDTFVRMSGWEQYLIAVFVAMFATSASCGYAAVATRRFLERRGWHLLDDRQH